MDVYENGLNVQGAHTGDRLELQDILIHLFKNYTRDYLLGFAVT